MKSTTTQKKTSVKSASVTAGLLCFALLLAAGGEYELGGAGVVVAIIVGKLMDQAKPFVPHPSGYAFPAVGVGSGIGSGSGENFNFGDSSTAAIGSDMPQMVEMDNSIDLHNDYLYHDNPCNIWHDNTIE